MKAVAQLQLQVSVRLDVAVVFNSTVYKPDRCVKLSANCVSDSMFRIRCSDRNSEIQIKRRWAFKLVDTSFKGSSIKLPNFDCLISKQAENIHSQFSVR